MLHELQVTSAPKAVNVSINTAVWIVMCKHPAIRAPFKGCSAPYSSLSDIRPGISASASSISFLPHSAREISFTLYGKYFVDALLMFNFLILGLQIYQIN